MLMAIVSLPMLPPWGGGSTSVGERKGANCRFLGRQIGQYLAPILPVGSQRVDDVAAASPARFPLLYRPIAGIPVARENLLAPPERD